MKFLHLAFAVGGAWFRQDNKKGLTHTRTVACHEAVQFDVGGHKYFVQEDDVGKYPSSLLYQMTQLGKDQNKNNIKINRNGSIFKHVNTFLLYGQLPRGANGKVMMDEQTLKELKTEADFYRLDGLSAECDSFLKNTIGPDFQSYFSVRDYVDRMLEEHRQNRCVFTRFTDYTDFFISAVPTLSHALKCLWVPFCTAKKIFWYGEKFDFTVADIVAAPFSSTFSSTVTDTRNCIVDASQLKATVFDEIILNLKDFSAFKNFAPHLDLTLHPKRLVLQTKGFSQEQSPVLQSTNDTGLIGKLVLFLNSTYTGGELEVTHNGHTEVVTGPYNWVAMYGDCLHKINPVTSGTRATLIFDIYGKNRDVNEDDNRMCFNNSYDENDLSTTRDLANSPSDAQKEEILKCLDIEMSSRDSLVLGLQHQYHYNDLRQMPTVDMLTGGDKALYEVLTSSGEYDVTLLSFTVQQIEGDNPTVRLFSRDTLYKPVSCFEKNDDSKRSAVVMPHIISKEWVLCDNMVETEGDWRDYRSETVYLMSGLRVSRKKQT